MNDVLEEKEEVAQGLYNDGTYRRTKMPGWQSSLAPRGRSVVGHRQIKAPKTDSAPKTERNFVSRNCRDYTEPLQFEPEAGTSRH